MAATVVNHVEQRSSGGGGGGTDHSVSFNVGSLTDGALFMGFRATDAGDISAVQFNGDAATYIGIVSGLEYWVLVNPDQGSAYNVTWTGPAFINCHYAFSSWSGVDQTTPNGTPVTATGTSGTPSTGSVTCPANGAVLGILRHLYSGSDATNTAGTQIGTYRDGPGVTIAHAYRTSTGAVSWGNLENYAWEAVGIPINAAGGGGGSTVPLNVLSSNQGTYLARASGR